MDHYTSSKTRYGLLLPSPNGSIYFQCKDIYLHIRSLTQVSAVRPLLGPPPVTTCMKHLTWGGARKYPGQMPDHLTWFLLTCRSRGSILSISRMNKLLYFHILKEGAQTPCGGSSFLPFVSTILFFLLLPRVCDESGNIYPFSTSICSTWLDSTQFCYCSIAIESHLSKVAWKASDVICACDTNTNSCYAQLPLHSAVSHQAPKRLCWLVCSHFRVD